MAVPDIYYDRLALLTPQEKEQLRAFLVSPVYIKLLRIVAGKKPSANCAGAGSRERDQFSDARANARLGEIRGWEYYEACIFMALTDAPAPRPALQENFPEAGFLPTEPAKKKKRKT